MFVYISIISILDFTSTILVKITTSINILVIGHSSSQHLDTDPIISGSVGKAFLCTRWKECSIIVEEQRLPINNVNGDSAPGMSDQPCCREGTLGGQQLL